MLSFNKRYNALLTLHTYLIYINYIRQSFLHTHYTHHQHIYVHTLFIRININKKETFIILRLASINFIKKIFTYLKNLLCVFTIKYVDNMPINVNKTEAVQS